MEAQAPPTILIIGATGNTGRGVTATLPSLLKSSTDKDSVNYRILAVTRSLNSPASRTLAAIPNIEVIEHTWQEITSSWLRSQNVQRIFIAPHNGTNAFAEESSLLVGALTAGVQYIVRISTNAPNVRADSPVYYARTHWAIESLLGSREFRMGRLHWTSLQPNGFAPLVLFPAAAYINEFQSEGSQQYLKPLKLLLNEDVGAGIIDPFEVGVFAAHLLVSQDTERHNGRKYVLNGPEDVSGEDIVKLVEEVIGESVDREKVVYRDMSIVDGILAATTSESRHVVGSIRHAMEASWAGECKAVTTSMEVLEIAAPKRTARDVLMEMVEA
ncbi:hypothetical protein BDW74DRAFT_189736 [Aspergillus multicolor]|uniref:uncharacterized protein n=1 Tax=Aspergillus multicolor TaxID=41759 RepID=UPI003CCCEE83